MPCAEENLIRDINTSGVLKVELAKLRPWQKDVFDDVVADDGKQYTYVVKAKRQIGKSILAETIVLYCAFKKTCISCIVEPTLSQCRRVYKQLITAIGGEKSPCLKTANATLLEIEFVNGSQVVFKSAEQGEALRGLTVTKGGVLIIDEGAYIDKEIYDILMPITDACKAPVMYLSTPLFCSGEFYEKYMLGLKGGSFVKSYDWSRYDTSEFLDADKLEYYRLTMSALKFRSEIMGEFITEGSYVFGDISKNYGELSKKPCVSAGLDWGSTGTDSTTLILMDEDRRVCDIQVWKNLDSVDLVDRISEYLSRVPQLRTLVVETNSIGDVYLGMLKRKVRKGLIREFTTTNESKRRVIENLIRDFQTGKITIPQDKELTKQLQHYGMEKTPSGKITYNGQNSVHDDYVIALALANDGLKNTEKRTTVMLA